MLCAKCVQSCVFNALTLEGKRISVTEAMKELERDEKAYSNSGGGITLSGGDALLQPSFSAAVLEASKQRGWDTAIETTACVPWENIALCLPHLSRVLLDIKHSDSEIHKKFTGVPNELIVKNAKRIASESDVRLIVRVPVIPRFNASVKDILGIAGISKSLGRVEAVHLLPYHGFGEGKYEGLNRKYAFAGQESLAADFLAELLHTAESELAPVGIPCLIGG